MEGTHILSGGSSISVRQLQGRLDMSPIAIEKAAEALGVFRMRVRGELFISRAAVSEIEAWLRLHRPPVHARPQGLRFRQEVAV